MFSRTFSPLALLAIAACSQPPEASQPDLLAAAEAEARSQLAESGQIYCALDGASEFRLGCMLERTRGQDGLVLTLHHPDGGFRRLLVTGDGRGVIAADGAEPAIVSPVSADTVEVAIADDRYRLPATVRR